MTNGKTNLRFLAVLLTLCMVLTLLAFTPVDPSILPEDLLMEGSQVGGEETAADVPADDEEVRAIIILEDPSLVDRGYSTLNLADNQAALTYSDKLMAGQEVALQRIQTQVLKGQPLDVAYRFTIGVNGIAITAPYGKLAEMERVPGVKSGVSGAAI